LAYQEMLFIGERSVVWCR